MSEEETDQDRQGNSAGMKRFHILSDNEISPIINDREWSSP